jgi:CheY-like chemotaxis protein
VLVADDDAMTLQVLRTVLDLEEFEVTLAEDGQKALDLALAQPFDAAVLDQMMPGLSGLELLARLRAEPATSDLPIVLLTAATPGSLPDDPIKMGADAFLSKPFSPLHLIQVLEDLFEARR